MAQTTYSNLSQRTNAYAAKEMLAHAEPILCLAKFGMTKPMPKNKANVIKFRRPVPLAVATTPLTEGVPPTSKAMTYEDVTVTLSQYGDTVEITDVVHDLAEDPVLKDASMMCGEQAAETIETLMWGVLQGGTNVFYADTADTARTDVDSAITLGRQRAVTRQLKAERGKKITSMLSSSVKYGTEAVDAAFIAFAHTDLEADIRDMTGFVPTEKYGSMKALPYEIGKVEDVRYILTPVLTSIEDAGATPATGFVSAGGTNCDVYPVVYVAKDAYGHVALKGAQAMTPSIINPGQIDKSDPLGQKGIVGWKTYHKSFIANQAWMARLEVAATEV